jgi:NitT/TauT family transport system substrate-binding protein
MCNVWTSVGEKVNTDLVNTLYDSSYIDKLSGKYNANEFTATNTAAVVTDDNKQEVINATALLTKSTTVNFVANTAQFLDSSDATSKLNEFIEIAKVLDGSIIQIEGNIASNNASDSGVKLSEQRAETVKKYFVLNGVDANRIIVIGNGGNKPVAPNNSEENMQKNRRTDISFKCVE